MLLIVTIRAVLVADRHVRHVLKGEHDAFGDVHEDGQQANQP